MSEERPTEAEPADAAPEPVEPAPTESPFEQPSIETIQKDNPPGGEKRDG